MNCMRGCHPYNFHASNYSNQRTNLRLLMLNRDLASSKLLVYIKSALCVTGKTPRLIC
jgi:hypothetical protein